MRKPVSPAEPLNNPYNLNARQFPLTFMIPTTEHKMAQKLCLQPKCNCLTSS